MPALPVPQQSDWNNNVYVIATTRIFVIIGMAYLIKSLYNLLPSIWEGRSASVAASRFLPFTFNFHQCGGGVSLTCIRHRRVVADGIGLEDVISDAPVTVPGAVDTSPDLEANLTLGLRPPQPTYDPPNHSERSRANARAQNQGMEVSGSPTAAHAVPEHDVGVRNDDPHVEEDMDVAVGLAG